MKPAFRFFPACLVLAAVVHTPSGLQAAPLYKVDNTEALNLLTSWSTVSGAQTPNPLAFDPADVWYFNDLTMLGSKTVSLGADLTIAGLGLDNTQPTPTSTSVFDVVINSGNTLTLNGGTISGTGVSGGTGYSNAGIVLNRAVGGALTINADIALGAAQQWVTSRPLTVGGNINLNANTLSFNTAGSAVCTLSGVVSGSGNLNKAAGSGTLALANPDNTFSGTVTLIGGNTTVAKLANGGDTSSLGNGTGSIVLNGANLTYVGTGAGATNRAIDMRAGGGVQNNSATDPVTFTAANVIQGGTAGARTLTLGGSNAGDNTFHSILGDSGTAPAISRLQKSGTGKWIVTAAHTYSGATVINQGTLVVSGGAVLGGATGSTADEGNIWFTSVQSNGALHFESVANLGPADQIRFRNTGGTAGNGGALVYTGTTDQTLGKTIQCDSSIGIRIESNSAGGKLVFNGAFSDNGARPLYLGGTGTGANEFQTVIAGTRTVTKRDAGTWSLTGANTYSGATTITGGTLVLGAGNVLGNTAVSIGNATLAAAAGISDTVGTLDPTAAATINLGPGATLAFADSSAIDWTDGTLNLTGSFVSGSSLRFGTTNSGLTGDQLGKITASGFTGFALDADGFLTATAASGYSAWAATNSTAGTISQDHDDDGVPNGVEFFLGGNTNTTGFTTLPGVASNAGTLSVTWTKAAGYPGTYGTHFTVETSESLSGSWITETLGGSVTLTGNNVTYTFPAPLGTRKFARLVVTGP